MMLISRKRLRFAVIVLLLTVAVGVACGYLFAIRIARRLAEVKLVQLSTQSQTEIDAMMDESFSLLAILNASKTPFCSDTEITYFRQLIYHAVNLRDVGRMRAGKLECSALFGRDTLPQTALIPKMTRQDGVRIYSNVPPFTNDKQKTSVLQQGDSFVVLDPKFMDHLKEINPNSEANMYDVPSKKWIHPSGKPSVVAGAVIYQDAQGKVGDKLYATRCSTRRLFCTSSYSSYSAVLRNDHGPIVFTTFFGGVSGAFLGMLFLVLHQSNQSMYQQLRRAIRDDKLHTVYQPIVDLGSGQIVAAETLARWTDEDGFVVSPDIFVRLAEERGFIGELTELVTRHALRDFREVLRSQPDFRLGINVTASDLADARFLPMLDRCLAEAGVAARNLAIEVTESSTANKQVAIETIRQLHERGHYVEIDDFGTGYSSLAYLKDLSADAIKIDKAFTQAIGTHGLIGDILPQILSLADTLNLQVIVEGIETEVQSVYFANFAGPVLGQGWFYGRPIPAEEFLIRLNK